MLPIFSAIFLAELGDKTQLATVLFRAGGKASAPEVFVAAASALVLSTLLAVLFGAALSRLLSPRLLKAAAGFIFIALGAYHIYSGLPVL